MMLYILNDGLSDIAEPLTPEALAASHPAWGDEIRNAIWTDAELEGLRMLCARVPEYFSASGDDTGAVKICAVRAMHDEAELNAVPGEEPHCFVCGRTSSALDAARSLWRMGVLREWDSVLAMEQTSGRGQLRRPWSSPAGNVYGVLRVPHGAAHMDDFAPLTLGYLFAQAFRSVGFPVSLKWPNDLLLDTCKAGGILLEEAGELLVAGVGINLVSSPPTSQLRAGWAVPATHLQAHIGPDTQLSVAGVWQTLVNRVRFCYETEVVRCNREELTRRVQLHLAWVGRDVIVHGGDEEGRPGRLLGVNESGALRLLLSGHEHAVTSGSIILSSHAASSR